MISGAAGFASPEDATAASDESEGTPFNDPPLGRPLPGELGAVQVSLHHAQPCTSRARMIAFQSTDRLTKKIVAISIIAI